MRRLAARTGTRLVLSAPLPAHAQAGAPQCDHGALVRPAPGATAAAGRDQAPEPAGERAGACRMDDPAIFEGMLCDDSGAVIGGVMSNLLIAKEGELFTPDLGQCGVAGVARTRLLRAASRQGIPTHITHLSPDAILAADEVMLCNSVIGIRRVGRLDDVTWSPAGWTETLHNALYEDVD
jgi:4-amino-4-deoxychorismate lyase